MDIPLFDGHCDTLSWLLAHPGQHLTEAGGQWELEKTERFAPRAQIFAAYADSALPGAAASAAAQIALLRRECRRFSDRITFCTTGQDAEAAARQGKLAAFLSVEGGELLGCSVERLDWAWRQGVRMVNLTWNHANALSGSHCEEPERGLSGPGKTFVREMRRRGMLVDVSHLSEAGFWDVMELGACPVIASHSNSRSVFFHSRSLTDAQFTAIMEYHGVVGLNAYSVFYVRKTGGRNPATCCGIWNTSLLWAEMILLLWAETGMAAIDCPRAGQVSGTGPISMNCCCGAITLSHCCAAFFITTS